PHCHTATLVRTTTMQTANLLEAEASGGPWFVPVDALDLAELEDALADAAKSLHEYNSWRLAHDMAPSGGHVITFCFLAANASTEQFRSLDLAWVARMSLADVHN